MGEFRLGFYPSPPPPPYVRKKRRQKKKKKKKDRYKGCYLLFFFIICYPLLFYWEKNRRKFVLQFEIIVIGGGMAILNIELIIGIYILYGEFIKGGWVFCFCFSRCIHVYVRT